MLQKRDVKRYIISYPGETRSTLNISGGTTYWPLHDTSPTIDLMAFWLETMIIVLRMLGLVDQWILDATG